MTCRNVDKESYKKYLNRKPLCKINSIQSNLSFQTSNARLEWNSYYFICVPNLACPLHYDLNKLNGA